MIKTIFSKKGLLFGLLLICLTEAVYIGHLMKKNTFLKEKLEKQQEELNTTLEKNEIYRIYESGMDFYGSIPLKITDGKHKFLIIVGLDYLKANLMPCSCKNDLELYGYSSFLRNLSIHDYFLYRNPEQINRIKNEASELVPYLFYKQLVANWDKMTLTQLLKTYTKKRGKNYYWDFKKIRSAKISISLAVYLYLKYRILVMRDCLGYGKVILWSEKYKNILK